MKTNEWYILCQFLLWAAGAQSHRGTLGDNVGYLRAQQKSEEIGYLCTPSGSVIGEELLLRALPLQFPDSPT